MAANSELEFNTEILKQKNESYSSLTDLNGVALFTDDYETLIEIKQQENGRKNSEIQQKLFVTEIRQEGADDDVVNTLFLNTSQEVVKVNTTPADQDLSLVFPAIGIVFCVFLLFMVQYYKKRRRKSEEKIAAINDKIDQ
ncbi:hypothetical protein [Eubacterium sp. 1001713B170207_170306_E7]|uniref:hypothetical protein n=1 Tax=Eubacterium sp. 1001713B170207_170306_E7 TaxID=2787097 RepID=UPI00189A24C3|nr:hypothetical protein [Eubacterium sp. 1001713B170207_170306_E7]